MGKKQRIVIVDANTTFRFIATEELKAKGYEIVTTVADGKTAVRVIEEEKPDIVLIDLVLPSLDGLGVMKQITSGSLEKKPVFIVSTAMSTEYSQTEAFKCGASYYLIKPYDFNVLSQRIESLISASEAVVNKNNVLSKEKSYIEMNKDLETEVTELLLELGVPAHIKGYQYLRASIMLATVDSEAVNAVTKILYPTVAKKFSTTSSRVERAIRHAIEVAWERGDIDILHGFFGYTVSNTRGKPTNSEFIALISDKLRLKNKNKSNLA